MACMRFGSAAIGLAAILTSLLQGCANTCEQWEVRPVTRQVCGRWDGSSCAYYTTQLGQERVCARQKPSAEPGRPGASGSPARTFGTPTPTARGPSASEVGLPDLDSVLRALFDGIRSPRLVYGGVLRTLQRPSELLIPGSAQMKALIKEARGGETAARFDRRGRIRHSLLVTVVRMKDAEAAAGFIELQRKYYSAGVIGLAPLAGVQAFAHDIVSANGRERSRDLTVSKGPYLVRVYEGRKLLLDDPAASFEPANAFSPEFALRQLASKLPAQ